MSTFSWFRKRAAAKAGRLFITSASTLSAGDRARLARERSLPLPVLEHYLTLLARRQIASDKLDDSLANMAGRYSTLSAALRDLPAGEPVVSALFTQAQHALESAAFERVESLLNEATDQALRISRAGDASEQLQFAAAAAKAANGELKNSELAYAEAADYYREAAELVPQGHPAALARYLREQGFALVNAGAFGDAEGPLSRALAICDASLDPMHVEAGECCFFLSWLRDDQGLYDEAERLCARALEIRERAYGPNHLDVGDAINNLGLLRRHRGLLDDAEALYLRAVTIYENKLGNSHPRLATTLDNLAAIRRLQGCLEEAEALYLRALAIRENALGPEHPQVACTANNLALVYDQLGRPQEALQLYERSLRISEEALGARHPNVVYPLANIAALQRARGLHGAAEEKLNRALNIAESALGAEHRTVAWILGELTALYVDLGRNSAAKSVAARALAIYDVTLGSGHPDTVAARAALADVPG